MLRAVRSIIAPAAIQAERYVIIAHIIGDINSYYSRLLDYIGTVYPS